LGIREKMCNRRKGGDGNGRDRRQEVGKIEKKKFIFIFIIYIIYIYMLLFYMLLYIIYY